MNSASLRFMVLISILGCVELITVKTPKKYVNVTLGGTILLPCTFVTTAENTDGLTILWNFESSSSSTPQQVYYYQSGKDITADSFKGRLETPSSPGTTKNASIIIRNMQQADAGVYTCQVHNFPDVDGQSEVNIIVDVLERPSVPYCSVHGDMESGHLVTLSCHSEHGSPKPTYTWTRLDQTNTWSRARGRATPGGILEIQNMTQFQFGEYRCNATNVVGYSTCTVELSPEVSDGVIAGAVIGALLGCVLILLVVWFIARTMKKHKYKSVKVSEANEMKSPLQVQEASESVPVATTADNLHAERDDAQA